MNRKVILLLAAILIPIASFSQKNSLNAIKIDEIKAHMKYLSADAMEGRKTGNEGNLKAGDYIAAEAQKLGLKPLPGRKDYFQTLSFIKITANPDSSTIILRDTLGNSICSGILDPVMVPSARIELSGDVVFAGYGYMNGKTKYSDFQGLSINNKIVIVMTRKPDLDGTGMPGAMETVSDKVELRKLTPLLMQNPKAILYVADPAYGDKPFKGSLGYSESDKLVPLFKSQSFNYSVNVYVISRETADNILASAGTSLSALQEKIASTKKPVSFILPGVKADLTVGVKKDTVRSSNVIGYFEGSDPVLKDEYVFYTAHYDHSGIDGSGNILNGANDNASGTIGLLSMAKAYSVLDKNPARSVVFLWTTGEEEGLYGSNYYINNPLLPIEKTVAELNFDMIGRSRMAADTGKVMGERLDITGPDTIRLVSARDCKELIDIASAAGNEEGIFVIDNGKGSHFNGSDHYPFALKGIPSVFFFTGLHRDYHKYTDDYEFIDFNKILKVSRTGFLTGYRIANKSEKLIIDTGLHK
jgi:hypothetical protein